MRYRSKPSEIEACQWRGDNLKEIEEFGVKFRYGPEAPSLRNPLKIKAGKDGAQGYVEVPAGHWIVRQPDDLSDHWPIADDYFQKKYEPVPDVGEIYAQSQVVDTWPEDEKYTGTSFRDFGTK